MVFELDAVRVRLSQLLEALYAGLDARFPEQANVVERVVLEPLKSGPDERRQRRAVFLHVRDQRHAKYGFI